MIDSSDTLHAEALRERYRSGTLKPVGVVESVLARIAARGDDKVWIHRLPDHELLAQAHRLEGESPDSLALYGLPFSIKDNIDLAGHPTTAGCPDFTYTPAENAPVVQRLLDAGAILVGKTNLDQFATGLVGTRSPYGSPSSVFGEGYVSGGSSSGSAVAVAAGLVTFSLGNDAAGSGRVPAAFNNIVGLKPSRGLLSNRGVVPACRSLDCVSVFALTVADAQAVFRIDAGFDPRDPFSRSEADSLPAVIAVPPERFRFGAPRPHQLEFFGNDGSAQAFRQALDHMEALGGEKHEIDFEPFMEAARLLYEGPWLAERYVAIGGFLREHPDSLFPVTRAIIEKGATGSATDAFVAYYRLKELRRETEKSWQEMDVLVTPTAGTIYTIAQVEADPIALNSNLGYYTNYVNLLDLSALAVPAGFTPDDLPFGVTLVARKFQESFLSAVGAALHRRAGVPMGATNHALPHSGGATNHASAGAPPG